MGLLDPNVMFYVLHEKVWKFGGGEIFDENQNKIGSMKRKLVSLRADIEIYDTDGTLLCVINRKLVSARPIYDVKTPDGNIIGRAKRAMIALHGSIEMYDSNEQPIYKAEGGVMKWDFRITAAEDKKRVLAVIRKADKWRDVFAKSFSFKDRYVIHIEQPDADRLMLLSYAIIVDNVYHDK